jgi:hypothetical protein
MRADPSPKKRVLIFEMANRAIMTADAGGPLSEFDGFEPKRWMSRVSLPD